MRTVDLDLLQELLAPYAAELKFDWNTLPADEAERRDALFILFKDGGEDFPDALLDALHCILTLSTPNGARALQEIADGKGVALVPESELAAPGDGKHLTPRHLALRAYLRHPGIFERAVHRQAFFAASPLRLVGARRGVVVLNENAAAQRAFKAACSVFFAKRYLGRICDIHWYPEAGLINVLIEHGMNAVTTTVEEEGEQKVRTIREMTLDAISFDPRTGHIKVNARSLVERRELVRLFATHLRRDDVRFEQMARCLGHHGLALVPSQVGLSDDQFVQAVLAAPGTRPDRYTVLEHLDLSETEVRSELDAFVRRLHHA
jgi:hypothetical protein